MTAKFQPGARVIVTSWSSRPATVVSCAKVRAVVRYDDTQEDKPVRLTELRAETRMDVKKREHEKALAGWQASRPKLLVSRIEYGNTYTTSRDERGATVTARTPEEMRTAAAELLEIAAWFDNKPQKAP